jgi:hypothetical protein
MKLDPKLKAVYSEARWPLTASDKYVIRVIWNRYCKLYKQHRMGKLKIGEYATRRRNYLNLIDDILGMYHNTSPKFNLGDMEDPNDVLLNILDQYEVECHNTGTVPDARKWFAKMYKNG